GPLWAPGDSGNGSNVPLSGATSARERARANCEAHVYNGNLATADRARTNARITSSRPQGRRRRRPKVQGPIRSQDPCARTGSTRTGPDTGTSSVDAPGAVGCPFTRQPRTTRSPRVTASTRIDVPEKQRPRKADPTS